tara:strand:+ start:17 stop:490 length:474 start_codon:yes stop_codon:yes gene_type:complete
MAYQKLQANRALAAIPSDTINIPNPAATAASGGTTATVASKLTDGTATFLTDNIKVGDIVYDSTNSVVTTVTAVDSDTALSVATGIPTLSEYVVYSQIDSPQNGCVLYVGGAGDLKVSTVGGDEVTFTGLVAGQFIPVNVLRVWATGTSATFIIALW